MWRNENKKQVTHHMNAGELLFMTKTIFFCYFCRNNGPNHSNERHMPDKTQPIHTTAFHVNKNEKWQQCLRILTSLLFAGYSLPIQFHMVRPVVFSTPVIRCTLTVVSIFSIAQSNVLDFTVSIVYFSGKSFLVNSTIFFSLSSPSVICTYLSALRSACISIRIAGLRSFEFLICSFFTVAKITEGNLNYNYS